MLIHRLILLLAAGLGPAAWACGACGCTLHSDWAAQGLGGGPGWRLDLRADQFTQDQLRQGTRAVDRGAFSLPADVEVQERTRNRNLTATLDWSPSADWGLSLVVPLYDRYHATVAEGDTEPSFSAGRGLGDVRILGRYQGFGEGRNAGLLLGLKVPTGAFHQTFGDGAQAGQPLDRGLQRGSGTTDLLAGAFAFGAWSPDWGWFAQALVQKPLGEREGFRPGDGLNTTLGVRFMGAALTPYLQLNARLEGRDSGVAADAANSGATLVYLSPGLAWEATRAVQVYAFVQVPVAQRVTGLQLEPRLSLSLGAHWSF